MMRLSTTPNYPEVLADTPDFDSEWRIAPRTMTTYVEREIAELWFRRGGMVERERLLTTMNQDLKEMARLVGGRLQG